MTYSTINAQLEKGKWMVGGELDFSHSTSKSEMNGFREDDKNTLIQVSPGFGYFFADRVAGGLRLSIGSTKIEEVGSGISIIGYEYASKHRLKSNSIGLTPFLRYYFLPISARVNIFGEGSYTYSTGKTSTVLSDYYRPPGGVGQAQESRSSNKVTSHIFSLSAGPTFLINRNISIDLSIGYSMAKEKNTYFSNIKGNRILVGTGFFISLR